MKTFGKILLLGLLFPITGLADSNPNLVEKSVPPWAFLWQIAELQAPTGCMFTVPDLAAGYDPAKSFTLHLTDAKGNTDSMLIEPSDVFHLVIDMRTEVMTTSLSKKGKDLVTVGKPPNQPAANVLAGVRLGSVVCGQLGQ